MVNSIRDVGSPYLVVIEDEVGSSRRAPGIYRPDAEGKWLPLVPGRVLTGGAYQGILAELDLGEVDHRYEALAVVDGKLKLFISTRNPGPESVITIGAGGTQVFDLNGLPVELPEITHVEDISVWEASTSHDGQAILISIRTPHAGLLGDGVTFGFHLKASHSPETQETLTLSTTPLVVDYRFLRWEELRTLAGSDSEKVISRLVLNSLYQKRKKVEPETLADWYREMKTYFDNFYSSSIGNRDRGRMPMLDLRTGEISIRDHLRMKFQAAGSKFSQNYDIISGQDEVTVLGQTINGRVNADPYLQIYDSGKNSSTALIYINSQLYFVNSFVYGEAPVLLPLERRTPVLPSQGSFYSKRTTINGETHHYLFFSYIKESKEQTDVYVVKELAPGVLSLQRSFQISSHFIQSDELAERVTESKEGVLFDDQTPIQGSKVVYQQRRIPTTPWLNITETESPFMKVQSYTRALDEKRLTGEVGAYKTFDQTGAIENVDGLYLFGAQADSRIVGELLQKEESPIAEIRTKEIKITSRKHEARVSLVALDAGHQHGANSFKLITIIASSEKPTSPGYFEPIHFSTNIPFPFAQFTGANLIFSRIKAGHQFSLIAGFRRDGVKKGGTLLQNWKMNFVQGKTSEFLTAETEVSDVSMISHDSIEADGLLQRIKLDLDGVPYWVITPEINPKTEKYELKNLLSNIPLFPNTAGGKSIQLSDDLDTFRELSEGVGHFGENSQRYRQNKWRVWQGNELNSKLGLDQDIEVDQYYSKTESFPGMEKVLEEIVDPSRPAQHHIFIVSEPFYIPFLQSLSYFIGHKKGPKGPFHFSQSDLFFNVIDSSSSQAEIVNSLHVMLEPPTEKQRNVVLGNAEQLFRLQNFHHEDDEESMMLQVRAEDDSGPEVSVSPPLLYLLAAEGRKVSLSDIRAGNIPQPKIPMIFVATPAGYEKLFKHSGSEYFGKDEVSKTFQINTRFLNGSWKVWGPQSPHVSNETKVYASQPVSDLDKQVFPNLSQTLLDLSSPEMPPQHRVLLAPKDLKPLIKKQIFSWWASNQSVGQSWSYRNPNLELYKLESQNLTQTTVFENFAAMRGASSSIGQIPGQAADTTSPRRAVLVAELQDMLRVIRPGDPAKNPGASEPFLISDWIQGPEALGFSSESGLGTLPIQPHLLYLFETEGQKVSLEDFATLPRPAPEVSILMLGDPGEWDALRKELTLESRVNLAQRISEFELRIPSTATRRDLLVQLVSSPEMNRLNYEFNATDLGVKNQTGDATNASGDSLAPSISKEKLLAYLVNRAETLAGQFNEDVTSAFLKVFASLRLSLLEDPELRNSKMVDRPYLERLLSKVFSIPLNLNILPANDPYVQLSNDRAPLRLQEAGYRGPLELKAQVIRTLLAPTRNDPARAVPGSIIVFGDSSTGKTMLFKTVMKMLGLKEYQYSNPSDEQAGYMVVNVGRLTSDKVSPHTEIMTVNECLKHISNFLSLPRGFRGHILFDDMHKGDKEVIKTLLKFLQSLFDAEKGMIRVERMGNHPGTSTLIEIPVRNIHPWMTLNPTQDQQRIERYAKKNGGITDVDVVVATLSSDDNPIEKSFLMRWGLVLNVSKFPLDAKAPALSDSLRSNSRNDFNVQGRLTLVSPQAVNQVVAQFPDSNAREFLSAATSQLLQGPNENGEKGSLFVVVPTSLGSYSSRRNWGSWEATGRENGNIESHIRNTTVAVPVSQRVDGRLHLLSLMVDSFRTSVYESFVDAATQSERFAASPRQLKNILAPLLHGVTSNFVHRDFLSLNSLELDSQDFIDSKIQRTEFLKLVEQGSRSSSVDFKLPEKLESSLQLDGYFDRSTSYYQDRNRAQVVTEFQSKISDVLSTYLELILRVDTLSTFPTSEQWLNSLGEKDQWAEFHKQGQKLADLYLEFWSELYDPRLVENKDSGNYSELSTYDIVRIYANLVDSSIAHLPWGRVNRFVLKTLDSITSDLEIGQRPGVQHYLFNSKASLLKPANHELVLQMATSSQAYKEWSDEFKKKVESEFESHWKKAFQTSAFQTSTHGSSQ